MFRRSYCTLATLALLSPVAVPAVAADAAPARSPAAIELRELFDAEWERGLRENPVGATYIGDARYNDRWPDRSPAALEKAHAADRAALARLERIDGAQLSDAELDALITDALAGTGAASIKDMGKVMAVVKARAAGKADMGAVGARIKAKLGG